MFLALEEYRDIDMIKNIATVFKPTIDVCRTCTIQQLFKYSWMDVWMEQQCMYLKNYFQKQFRHQIDEKCIQTTLLRSRSRKADVVFY